MNELLEAHVICGSAHWSQRHQRSQQQAKDMNMKAVSHEESACEYTDDTA